MVLSRTCWPSPSPLLDYRRWWAVVAQAVLLVLIGWLINRWRYHSVLHRKNELERIVHERTDQLRHRSRSLRQESEGERLVRILSTISWHP